MIPLIMLKSSRQLKGEIVRTQNILGTHGIRPLVFPAPCWHYQSETGTCSLGTWDACRQFFLPGHGQKETAGYPGWRQKYWSAVRPGDIILLHDLKPRPKTQGKPSIRHFLTELECILDGLESQNLAVVPLSETDRATGYGHSGRETEDCLNFLGDVD